MRYLTAGESHGPALIGVLEGMPAGLRLSAEDVNRELGRRQAGYGRGQRMRIEQDEIEWLSGVRFGETLGSPIAVMIRNKDFERWRERMAPEGPSAGAVFTRPRPGHADLAGALKYGRRDARDILERASARETAMRVALGAMTKALLRHFGIEIVSHVVALGDVTASPPAALDLEAIDRSPVRCADPEASAAMVAAIDEARIKGDTLGGVIEVLATGVPVGLGAHVHWDRKLDGRLGHAMLSVPAIKGLEIGAANWGAARPGSEVHDEIFYRDDLGFTRETNRAGGSEGGISNGQPIWVRAAMKPLSSLHRPLRSIDMESHEEFLAQVERSDITAVPAAGVVLEAVMALVLAELFLEKFSGDAILDVEAAYRHYLGRIRP